MVDEPVSERDDKIIMSTGEKITMFDKGSTIFIGFIIISTLYLGVFIYFLILGSNIGIIIGALPFLFLVIYFKVQKRITILNLDIEEKDNKSSYYVIICLLFSIFLILLVTGLFL
jgi:hypothetical protein